MKATKNQKQTMSFTRMSAEDNMYDKVVLKICQKGI